MTGVNLFCRRGGGGGAGSFGGGDVGGNVGGGGGGVSCGLCLCGMSGVRSFRSWLATRGHDSNGLISRAGTGGDPTFSDHVMEKREGRSCGVPKDSVKKVFTGETGTAQQTEKKQNVDYRKVSR